MCENAIASRIFDQRHHASLSDNDLFSVRYCYCASKSKATILSRYIQIRDSYLLLGDLQRLQAVTDDLQFLLQLHDLAARAESRTLESIQGLCIDNGFVTRHLRFAGFHAILRDLELVLNEGQLARYLVGFSVSVLGEQASFLQLVRQLVHPLLVLLRTIFQYFAHTAIVSHFAACQIVVSAICPSICL